MEERQVVAALEEKKSEVLDFELRKDGLHCKLKVGFRSPVHKDWVAASRKSAKTWGDARRECIRADEEGVCFECVEDEIPGFVASTKVFVDMVNTTIGQEEEERRAIANRLRETVREALAAS